MKKRLRKKKHMGEFTEWGRQLFIVRNRKDGFDEFLDVFTEEAIESNGCYCGGGGKEDKLDVVVELGRRSDDPDAKLNKIKAWLEARPDVKRWKVGEEFDIWHGDFQDIDDELVWYLKSVLWVNASHGRNRLSSAFLGSKNLNPYGCRFRRLPS